jgi:hypothetical protein
VPAGVGVSIQNDIGKLALMHDQIVRFIDFRWSGTKDTFTGWFIVGDVFHPPG